jgi:hypothetical protein
MKTDLYAKIVLTTIALCLLISVVRDIAAPRAAHAGDRIAVEIERVSPLVTPIPVRVER